MDHWTDSYTLARLRRIYPEARRIVLHAPSSGLWRSATITLRGRRQVVVVEG